MDTLNNIVHHFVSRHACLLLAKNHYEQWVRDEYPFQEFLSWALYRSWSVYTGSLGFPACGLGFDWEPP